MHRGPGIVAEVERAVGVEPRDLRPRHAAEGAEKPADQQPPVRLQPARAVPRDHVRPRPWIETGIERAVCRQPRETGPEDAVHSAKTSEQDRLAVGLKHHVVNLSVEQSAAAGLVAVGIEQEDLVPLSLVRGYDRERAVRGGEHVVPRLLRRRARGIDRSVHEQARAPEVDEDRAVREHRVEPSGTETAADDDAHRLVDPPLLRRAGRRRHRRTEPEHPRQPPRRTTRSAPRRFRDLHGAVLAQLLGADNPEALRPSLRRRPQTHAVAASTLRRYRNSR